MKFTKKALAIILTLCMFFTSVPFTVYAEDDVQKIQDIEGVVADTEEIKSESETETIELGSELNTEKSESAFISEEAETLAGESVSSAKTSETASGTSEQIAETTETKEEMSSAEDQTASEKKSISEAVLTDDVVEAASLTSDSTVVIAGSDFQNPSGNDAGAQTVTGILNTIKTNGYDSANGFLFCGDYDYDTVNNSTETADGLNALKNTVKGIYSSLTDTDMIMVQGNHDAAGVTGLAESGAHDSTDYGVYVINEDDYMWRNSDEAMIKNTADSLDSYLNTKIQAGYSKPVFVVSHLPLHYTMRTKNDGDGMYANYIFDVLDAAGECGLNIIFLYGHDHSNGWDDYLGGSSVYLAKGDRINIAQASKTEFAVETLDFTYMNAGFTGYYENHNDADDALTMTVFSITDDQVQVERYDAEGRHALKSAGVTNNYKNESGYSPDTNEYQSPQNIEMETVKPQATVSAHNVEVTASGLTDLTIEKKNIQLDTTRYSAYASYDITPVGYTQGNTAKVTITLDTADGFDASRNVMVIDKTGQNDAVRTGITDGKVTFTTNHFSTYDIAQAALDGNGERVYTHVTSTDQLENGQYLLIYNADPDKFMLPEKVTKTNKDGSRTGFNVEDTDIAGPDSITGDYSAKEWTFTKSGSGWKIGTASGNIKLKQTKSYGITATLESPGSTFTINGSADRFEFKSGDYYLNYNSRGLINGYSSDPAPFYIYKYTGTSDSGTEIKSIASVTLDNYAGSVQKGSSLSSKTGSVLTVTYTDGTSEKVPVTVTMLSGSFSMKETGTYENLTVTYGDYTFNNYILEVTPKSGNDYPEYPHEGSVRVNKTGEGIDFQSSGIAKVELSATGVPVKKGADVIIMLDTSSSMTSTVDGKTRITVLKESLKNLIQQFKKVGEDGEQQDIRVAVADFNGYVRTGEDNTPYYLNSDDHLKNGSVRSGTNNGHVFTGSATLNAGAFVDVNTLEDTAFDGIGTHSGTNYDYAFDAVYQLGEDINAQNDKNGEERDLFVIFMSDGAPFQYNYFSAQSGESNWNNWLQGTITDDMLDSGAHNYFYNGDGNKHRMAEAIKGDRNTNYTVIRKDSTDNYGGQQYMTQLPGLGATMYSIGFCLAQDNQITVASMEHVLKSISSNPEKFYYSVNTAAGLNNAFTVIGNDIAYAATNARFVDTMGADYDLQLKTSNYTLSDGSTKTITPEIIVQAYDIYTKADGVEEAEIGKRKGTSTQLEKVTFNTDGTEAYSDKKSDNILVDGVICANTFWYNTTANTVKIDTDGDGTAEYSLAPETFYWKMGTVNQTELALSYYVYLTGSMEGKREAGSYPTNESASLYYTNWLGNDAKKDTVSPVLAWKSANVSYAFYLVDDNGNIIVNKSTGQTGSFANKVAVTNPVVYSEVLLNSGANVQAGILASEVLPEGYTLFDEEAAYNVTINSNSTGSWMIAKGTDAATTYVTEYGGNPTTILKTSDNSYDYTHTVVWFAVKYVVKAIPDAVVIDYGLPVDIHVLKNDMFYDKGTLEHIGAEKTDGAASGDQSAAFTGNTYTGQYGNAEVVKNTSVPEDSVVRYTPSDMNMSSADKFSYAVNYSGEANSGYYYGTVTVIPATTIYYEDNFVTYTDAKDIPEGDSTGKWTVDGTEDSSATQDEDRPGTSSLSSIDANNVYGYDSAYKDCTRYSLGSARKVTVNAATGAKATAPEAGFTFTGTGFDVISLTDNDSGTIVVTVKDDSGTVVRKQSVDNYYGYTYGDLTDENGAYILDDSGNRVQGWYVDKTSEDTIWQVPVIKIEGLDYGTYTVTIQTAYTEILDHQGDGSYSFWLDAIRVYDSAQNDETAQNAYIQDKEASPQYFTLRNLLVEQQKALNVEGQMAGVVFIDGKDSTESIIDYANPGPNNETYLAYGQGISFKLSAPEKPVNVQLGVKLAYGSSATLKWGDKDFRTVTTSTDMYYKMDGLNWTYNKDTGNYETDVITLTNATEAGVISITNLKYTSASVTTADTSVMSLVIDEETVESSVMMVRALYAPVIEEEAFVPEYMTASWKAGRVKRQSILTVTTSDDVEWISVNGADITKYAQIPIVKFQNFRLNVTYKRIWIYTEKINETGSYSYDVTAYNADGVASKPIETVLTVSE